MDILKTVVIKLLLAIVVSAIIGCERASKRHSAGLRTFVVVTLGCTIVMMLETYLKLESGESLFILSAAAIVAVASISVNTVLYSSKGQIKGLTTAASLWVCGIIGLVIGAGQYLTAVMSFIALYITISFMPVMEQYLKNHSNHFEIMLELKSSSYLQDFVTTARELGITIDEIELNPAYVNSGLSVYSIAVSINSAELKKYKTHKEIIEALASIDYIHHIEEML